MLISLLSIAVNYVMNSLLVGPFGHVGLACSTSAVALVNFLLLALFMRRRLKRLEGRRLGATVLRIIAATIPMAFVAWLVSESAGALPVRGLALESIRVAAAIVLATLTFYASCKLLRIEELNEAIESIGGRFFRRLARR
jgi:putative peptidoglycan lipid II flippase